MTTAQAPPSIPTWEQIANVIDTELEKVCKTGMDPQEAADGHPAAGRVDRHGALTPCPRP